MQGKWPVYQYVPVVAETSTKIIGVYPVTGIRYLVTGANGFVGQRLCRKLVELGHPVKGVFRSAQAGPVSGVEPSAIGEIDGQTDWNGAFQGISVVIHLAARVHVMHDHASDPLAEFRRINTAGTERLARSAAAAGVQRLIYVSSIKVNGEETRNGHMYTEADAPDPQDAYAISKWEAECALHRVSRETGLEMVIVRPPVVYGPCVKGNFAQMLHMIKKGMPLPLASVRNNRRSLVYVGNLVDALIACSAHPAAAGQTYLVSDGEDVSTEALLRTLAAGMGEPARLFPCPLALLKAVAMALGKRAQAERLVGSLQVDSGKIRRQLNWVPPYTLQQGLQATAEWHRTQYT
jgi:nucleoside-diphosphate-sugar epimerase